MNLGRHDLDLVIGKTHWRVDFCSNYEVITVFCSRRLLGIRRWRLLTCCDSRNMLKTSQSSKTLLSCQVSLFYHLFHSFHSLPHVAWWFALFWRWCCWDSSLADGKISFVTSFNKKLEAILRISDWDSNIWFYFVFDPWLSENFGTTEILQVDLQSWLSTSSSMNQPAKHRLATEIPQSNFIKTSECSKGGSDVQQLWLWYQIMEISSYDLILFEFD